ncbi:MAG TPA: hypothetical protein PK253_12860 [Spirochaetota bacterium]|nr:hypothetical protein [Spirochaetota bacterium]
MNRLEEKIIHDAETRAEEIREKGKQDAAHISVSYEEKLQQLTLEKEKELETLYTKEITRRNVLYSLEESRDILAQKISCIEEVIEDAANRILTTDTLFQHMVRKAVRLGTVDGTEILYFSPRHESLFKGEFSDSLHAIAAEKTGSPASLEMRRDDTIREGGIILKGSRRELNATKQAIIQELREKYITNTAAILFPGEGTTP